jgi:hypothetical membrane protein
MDTNQHELYEYARLRIKQKKRLYFHFVLMVVGGLFLLTSNYLLGMFPETHWSLWAITIWAFIFVLHFIRVFVTDSFMNKKWEREQIDKLIAKQERRIEQLQKDLDKNA